MSRCVHSWTKRSVRANGIGVTVLTCRRCARTLVQTYRHASATNDSERERAARIEATALVRNDLNPT